jgi:hypothetical protein
MNILIKKEKYIFVCVLVICMIAGTLACMSKSGMHEDEFYSYYSSNRTNGFYAEHTVSTEVMLDELKVLDGCGYNFPLVKEVQSWDVHPPIYYFVLHFVCSLTSGIFSVWQGLMINLIFLAISLILMKRLGTIMLPDNPLLVDIVIMAWGLSPALLSGVVFIRMYMLLTVWILAVTILHMSYLPCTSTAFLGHNADDMRSGSNTYTATDTSQSIKKRAGIPLSFWILLWILTFLGFMTHYYFLIWLVFLGGAWNVILISDSIRLRKQRNTSLRAASTIYPASEKSHHDLHPASDEENRRLIHPTIIYVMVELSCAAACYLFYPAFPAQMFKGQRGAQATGNFFDLSNTWDRLCFFASKINHLGFGGGLWILLGLILIIYNLKLMKTDGRLKYQNSYMAPRGLYDSRNKWESGNVLPPDDITGTYDMINNMNSEYDETSSDPLPGDTGTSPSMSDIQSKRSLDTPVMICLVIALIGYFLVISKTALILGDSSIRYHMPVLGVGYLVIAALIRYVSDFSVFPLYNDPTDPVSEVQMNDPASDQTSRFLSGSPALVQNVSYLSMLLITVILIMNLIGDFTGRICFLYPENKEHLLTLSDHRDPDVYYIYPDGQSWIMWAEGTQLLTFDKVTYLSVSEIYELSAATDISESATDPDLISPDGLTAVNDHSDPDSLQDTTGHEMIIYISSGEDSDDILNIFGQYISRTDTASARLLFSDDYTNTYLITPSSR